MIERLGPEKLVETATRMGIRCCTATTEPSNDLLAVDSAVLGSNEVNTLEMASAYGTLATAASTCSPRRSARITTRTARRSTRRSPSRKLVVDPKIVSVADGILQKVVLYGTGTNANIGRPQIGKTGTEDNYTNAWFVGAIPQLMAAVWVGFPQDNLSMAPPRTRITVFGGTWPARDLARCS